MNLCQMTDLAVLLQRLREYLLIIKALSSHEPTENTVTKQWIASGGDFVYLWKGKILQYTNSLVRMAYDI